MDTFFPHDGHAILHSVYAVRYFGEVSGAQRFLFRVEGAVITSDRLQVAPVRDWMVKSELLGDGISGTIKGGKENEKNKKKAKGMCQLYLESMRDNLYVNNVIKK